MGTEKSEILIEKNVNCYPRILKHHTVERFLNVRQAPERLSSPGLRPGDSEPAESGDVLGDRVGVFISAFFLLWGAGSFLPTL